MRDYCGQWRLNPNQAERRWLDRHRNAAAQEQRNLCCYCTEPLTPETISADHIIAKSAGGRTQRDNIVAACIACNRARGAMPVPEFVALLLGPTREASMWIWLAYARRRIWLRTHQARGSIMRAAGIAA